MFSLLTLLTHLAEEIILHVSYEEYYKRLVDQADFNIACLATVHDTNFEYFAQDDFRVRKPDIKLKVIPTFTYNTKIGISFQT